MSIYDPIWEKIKKEGTAEVVVNRHLHRRLIKAVKKRKYFDISYKIQLDPHVPIMHISKLGNTIIFTLEIVKNLVYESNGNLEL